MTECIRVLVVDDSEFFGTIVAGELERLYDMEAVQTTDSTLALDRLESGSYDCIVSDYDMPDLDGIELFETIRERGFDLPFFLLTAAGSEEVASRAITAGIDDYFNKARGEDQFEILGNRIENVVSKRRAAADLERQRTLHQTLWNVTQDLLHAQTEAEISRHVSAGVVAVDQFDLAWVESVENEVVAAAGFGEVEQPTAGRALANEGSGIVGNATASGELETTTITLPEEQEGRTVVVLPLGHRGTVHGTLVLWSEPGAVIRKPGRQSLSHLGTTVGHALATVEMRREIEIFQTAVQQAETAIAITDPEGTISYANTAFHEITGYESDELHGNEVDCLSSDTFGTDEYAKLWDRVGAGETVRMEVEQRRKDGGRFVADLSVAPVTVSGELRQFILVETDITELKSREQRLQVLNRVVRHNLRNDLNVVKGNISLLLEDLDSEGSREQARVAQSKIDDLLEMSEKARLVNRVIEGADEDEVTKTRPLGTVMETLASSIEEQYPGSSVTVEGTTRDPVPEWSLEVCLRELLTNAIEHNDGVPEVVIHATTSESSDGMVAIDVADNGPGIPKVEREALSRGHETDLEHGSSLGLWLVHWITTYLGGELRIVDADDTGSTVRLIVPVETPSE